MRAHNVKTNWHTSGPIGTITRGTTGVNRIRRFDRWHYLQANTRQLLKKHPSPLAVDLGYGNSAITTCQWANWIRRHNPNTQVVGIEINPERLLPPQNGVRFELGGFELKGYQPQIVRAFNVIRQYDEKEVHHAWQTVLANLATDGIFYDGTCDEIGRRACWITLDKHGPRTLTLAWHPAYTERPSQLAQRIPKILISRNFPGTPLYSLLQELDLLWESSASYRPFGNAQQWKATVTKLKQKGVPLHGPAGWRGTNQLTVDWEIVKPN